MPFNSFESSNIHSISDVVDGVVNITFKSSAESGKQYSYLVTDSEAFVNDLQDVITEGESVGRYINRARRTGILQDVQVS